jgi:uncharacterized protein with FMN-binding domain
MKKGLSIFLVVLGVLVLILLIGVLQFNKQYKELLKEVEIEYALIDTIDMSQIDDGEYSAQFGKIPVSIDLKVVVKDHKIQMVKVLEQSSGPDHEALETIDRIITKQQPKVDIVSGATTSSRVIMIAVYKALIKNPS